MRYVEEFRNVDLVNKTLKKIASEVTRPWVIMEICGGQTHAIMQHGIDQLLPSQIELVHGPGCPVCVTPLELIDKALAIAARHDVIFCSFGDMLRVPGSTTDLLTVKACGSDVRIVYSPLDAVKIARENSEKQVVFFAIGFETTAPVNAAALLYAKSLGVTNFSLLVSQVTVPAAMHAILGSPTNRVQGFLAAGHVCSVMGYHQYHSIATKYRIPIVVTGFEPLDLLQGILMTTQQLERGLYTVENAYTRAVTEAGNSAAQKLISDVFEVCDRNWRGIGAIPQSGLKLRHEFSAFDAEQRFDVREISTRESEVCISGQVLQGIKKPIDCPAFGRECTPQTPLGATMVSSEGTCAAYYRYRLHAVEGIK
jgi:hydrogenase expression/formation protein HypD